MDPVIIALISATTALVSAVVGPLVSIFVTGRQIRASLISTNRERWSEALRDSIAEYVAIMLTLSMLRQSTDLDPVRALQTDHDLRETVERLAMVRHKIMLMSNPDQAADSELDGHVEAAYLSLISDAAPSLAAERSRANAITRAGRQVLRAAWARVKRGE